ncbi:MULTISPECIES: helix-turn-helix domain-containing protein [unclassified Aureispira]|uniref:helix-turn-helix domain-containing protein n=1 Tax=unclassified Aureispira TaxID=2649989 RepID=UPI000695E272|nr:MULTISPECIES: helix-turn-helix transcriptional regulator [unclassified Aureispira]WMX17065.1 helix-turn-helix transcriptional regulator [Aureispira sp. CCB-E]
MSINQRFKEIVSALEINASQLAKKLDVTRPTITRIINGVNEPSAKILAPLLKAYPQLDIKWLLIGEGEMFLKPQVEVNEVDKDYLDRLADSLERENTMLRKEVNGLAEELDRIRKIVEALPDED